MSSGSLFSSGGPQPDRSRDGGVGRMPPALSLPPFEVVTVIVEIDSRGKITINCSDELELPGGFRCADGIVKLTTAQGMCLLGDAPIVETDDGRVWMPFGTPDDFNKPPPVYPAFQFECPEGTFQWLHRIDGPGIYRITPRGVIPSKGHFLQAAHVHDPLSAALVATKHDFIDVTVLEDKLPILSCVGRTNLKYEDWAEYRFWISDGRRDNRARDPRIDIMPDMNLQSPPEIKTETLSGATYAIEVSVQVNCPATSEEYYVKRIESVHLAEAADPRPAADALLQSWYGLGAKHDFARAFLDEQSAQRYVATNLSIVPDPIHGDRLHISSPGVVLCDSFTPKSPFEKDPNQEWFSGANLDGGPVDKPFILSERPNYGVFLLRDYPGIEPAPFLGLQILYQEFGSSIFKHALGHAQLELIDAERDVLSAVRYIQARYDTEAVEFRPDGFKPVYFRPKGGVNDWYAFNLPNGGGPEFCNTHPWFDVQHLRVQYYPLEGNLGADGGSNYMNAIGKSNEELAAWLHALSPVFTQAVPYYPSTYCVQKLRGVWHARRDWKGESSHRGSWEVVGQEDDMVVIPLNSENFASNFLSLGRQRRQHAFFYNPREEVEAKEKSVWSAEGVHGGNRYFGDVLVDGADAIIDSDRMLIHLRRGESKDYVFRVKAAHWRGDSNLPDLDVGSFVGGITIFRSNIDELGYKPYDNGLIYSCRSSSVQERVVTSEKPSLT